MAKCIRCGKSGIFLKVNAIGICKNCEILYGQECFRQAYQKQSIQQPTPPTPSKPNKVITKHFDLNILEEINAIPVPPCPSIQNIEEYRNEKYDSVISKLQKTATTHKRNGNLDLAIACLRKSNELIPYSICGGNYHRLVEYLKLAGKFDEARFEEAKIESLLQQLDKIRSTPNSLYLNNRSEDLIQFSGSRICPYCSIYHLRIFSKSGTDRNFPPLNKLPFDLQGSKCPVCHCCISLYSYFEYIKDKTTLKSDIKFSNRPFVDDRTNELKQYFLEKQTKEISFKQDKNDYDWLREHLPDIAPKSFGGYRRMKNLKSENYLKIVNSAKEKGYLIK